MECRQCEVVCTKELHEAIRGLRERNKARWDKSALPVDLSPKTGVPRHVFQQPISARVEAPIVKNPAYAKRRVAKSSKGPGIGWRRNEGATIERVLELQRQGLQIKDIAVTLNCSRDLIHLRMREAKKDPAFAEIVAAMALCACGAKKMAENAVCTRCKWARIKKERAAQRIAASHPMVLRSEVECKL